jgi:hypothetical protein
MIEQRHIPSGDSIIFRYPFKFKSKIYLTMLGCYAFVSMTLVAALLAPPEDPAQWPWLIGLMVAFALGGIHITVLSRRLYDSFIVDDLGITQVLPDGLPVVMPWEEIEACRERFFSGSLVLVSQKGTKAIELSDRLEDFDLLRAWVEEKIRHSV